MPTFIHNIATEVPDYSYQQSFLREQMKEYVSSREATQRIIHRIYTQSGIDKRHTVIKDFQANGSPRLFFKRDGSLNNPSTGARNELYAEKAKPLFTRTAEQTIAENPTVRKEDITHVITVSCTGFFAPGPAFEIVQQLGLPPAAHRFHLGFMGCFAAFPALKMAQAFCEAQPEANVLIVCLELCTIHLQDSEIPDNLISASVFADGAAGMIVSSRKPEGTAFSLKKFSTSIAEESEEDMAWTIGDTGFNMILSTYVPEIIDKNLTAAIQPLLDTYQLDRQDIHHWAIHPGGRAILDNVESTMDLNSRQLASSRNVLAGYGNMSSATILFVLKDLLRRPQEFNNEHVLAMAFGPGLTIESGILKKISN